MKNESNITIVQHSVLKSVVPGCTECARRYPGQRHRRRQVQLGRGRAGQVQRLPVPAHRGRRVGVQLDWRVRGEGQLQMGQDKQNR